MKKCKVCKSPNSNPGPYCSVVCALKQHDINRQKKERKENAARKFELRSRRDWLKIAQVAFNAFIRERDKALPCICCGNTTDQKYGGSWDAGHFLSRGAYPELRFTEDNCHRQLKSCNAGSNKYAHKGKTVAQGYRDRLIQKIGIERVEWLEGPHPPQKWSIPDLIEIEKKFKLKLKELKCQN